MGYNNSGKEIKEVLFFFFFAFLRYSTTLEEEILTGINAYIRSKVNQKVSVEKY